jgi:flagellar basal-body rod modification protein FlgD
VLADISPVNSAAPKTADASVTGMLGKDGFLKILLAQMSHPDPLAPNDPGAFVTEIAQMALLEQMINLSSKMEAVYRLEALNQATALIGHEVLVTDGHEILAGIVEKILLSQGNISLMVDGKQFDSSNLLEVR